MRPLVSIIVPVYNAASYIRQCIESVINQSFNQWELLLIDDGSIDDSWILCKEYSNKDERIRAFSKINTGVSDTRNIGLSIASGKYVMFLDSDDYWCESDLLKTFVELSEKYNLDIIRGELVEVNSEGYYLRKSIYTERRGNSANIILDNVCFYREIVLREFFSVLCMFRKDTIGNINFNTQRVFLEDAEFYLDVCLRNLKCMYVPMAFYAYRKHQNSVSVKYVPNKFRDALNFTLVCFNKSELASQYELQLMYIKDGLRNFFYDLKEISELGYTYQERIKLYETHNIYNIQKQAISVTLKNRLHEYIAVLLPMNCIVYYYKLLRYFKMQIIRMLRIFKIYE